MIYLSNEKEVFEKKMKLENFKTMSHFLRECILEKEIYIVDMKQFRNIQRLLSNVTSNINQITKVTNMDIQDQIYIEPKGSHLLEKR